MGALRENHLATQVEVLAIDKREEWKEFLLESNNGTIFHDLDFLDYHPSGKFDIHHLLFRREGTLIALLPSAIVNEDGRRVLHSPYGASLGGFVTREDTDLGECLDLVDTLVSHAGAIGLDAVSITTAPGIYHMTPHHHLDFAYFLKGFRYTRRLLVSALDLRKIQKDAMDLFQGRMRTAIRKSQKLGVTAARADDLEDFYRILLENKKKHDAAPVHSLLELVDLKKRLPQHVNVYLAHLKGAPVAGVLVFVCNPRVATTFYICHLQAFQECNAPSLLLYHVIKEYASRGFWYMDLGPSVAPDMTVGWGVLKFKESLGTRGYFRDSWRLDLGSGPSGGIPPRAQWRNAEAPDEGL